MLLKELLPAVFAAATLLCAAAAGPQSPPKSPAQRPGAGGAKPPAAAAARPKITEIDENALKTLLGAGAGRTRPLLVNFWATWCVPCRDEFPDLVKIRQQYAAEQLDFILVSLDDPSDIDKAVPEFLSEVRANAFPSYLLNAADSNIAINLVDQTWSGELPATFLYDRSGQVAFKHKGRIKPAELRAALDLVLKDKPQEAGARK
ncbi:MAG: TlpA disulfide reductase family protein [Pyrinomonadaceae bacterium]